MCFGHITSEYQRHPAGKVALPAAHPNWTHLRDRLPNSNPSTGKLTWLDEELAAPAARMIGTKCS